MRLRGERERPEPEKEKKHREGAWGFLTWITLSLLCRLRLKSSGSENCWEPPPYRLIMLQEGTHTRLILSPALRDSLALV